MPVKVIFSRRGRTAAHFKHDFSRTQGQPGHHYLHLGIADGCLNQLLIQRRIGIEQSLRTGIQNTRGMGNQRIHGVSVGGNFTDHLLYKLIITGAIRRW